MSHYIRNHILSQPAFPVFRHKSDIGLGSDNKECLDVVDDDEITQIIVPSIEPKSLTTD